MDWAKKEAFFAAKVPTERMTVAGVGDVIVHGLTVGEKEQWQQDAFKVNAKTNNVTMSNADAQLLLLTVYDQHGKRFFDSKDMGRLLTRPSVIVEPLLKTAKRLSAIGNDDIEELVKNSQTAPGPAGEGSSTD